MNSILDEENREFLESHKDTIYWELALWRGWEDGQRSMATVYAATNGFYFAAFHRVYGDWPEMVLDVVGRGLVPEHCGDRLFTDPLIHPENLYPAIVTDPVTVLSGYDWFSPRVQ
jgi:hypothetical protein